MLRVAIVDDHPLARRGIEQILTESGRVHVVASVPAPADLTELLASGADHRPDVVILDLYFGGGTPSLSAAAELASQVRVLVMSVSGDRDDVLGAIRAGASGYMTKNASPELLVATVETVGAGGFALSPELADMVQAELGRTLPGAKPAALNGLSAREDEVLGLIARGFTHSQAATRMGVSKATVDTYVERIRGKLQLGNKAELTLAAVTRSLGRPSC